MKALYKVHSYPYIIISLKASHAPVENTDTLEHSPAVFPGNSFSGTSTTRFHSPSLPYCRSDTGAQRYSQYTPPPVPPWYSPLPHLLVSSSAPGFPHG